MVSVVLWRKEIPDIWSLLPYAFASLAYSSTAAFGAKSLTTVKMTILACAKALTAIASSGANRTTTATKPREKGADPIKQNLFTNGYHPANG